MEARWYGAVPQLTGDLYKVDTEDSVIVDSVAYADAIALPVNYYFKETTLEFVLGRQCSKFGTVLAFSDFTSRDTGVAWLLQTENEKIWEGRTKFGDAPLTKEWKVGAASRLVLTAKYFEARSADAVDPNPGPVLLEPRLYCTASPPQPAQ